MVILKIFKKNDMLNIVEKIAQDENINIYTKSGHIVNFGDINNLEYKIKRLKGPIRKNDNLQIIFVRPLHWVQYPNIDSLA